MNTSKLTFISQAKEQKHRLAFTFINLDSIIIIIIILRPYSHETFFAHNIAIKIYFNKNIFLSHRYLKAKVSS